MAATWQRSIEAFYGCGGVGKGRGARGLHQTLDSLARSVCDRTVMQLPNQLIIMPYFNKETFISVLDGRKALRHQVFMYMDCKCQHFCDLSVILLLCFTSLVRLICSFPPPPPPLEANKTHFKYLFVSWFISRCYVIFVIMQFPCCRNDWSDQQNKRTEILQCFRIS